MDDAYQKTKAISKEPGPQTIRVLPMPTKINVPMTPPTPKSCTWRGFNLRLVWSSRRGSARDIPPGACVDTSLPAGSLIILAECI